MSEPVYIDPATDEVRRLTAAALVASPTDSREPTKIRCTKCGVFMGALVSTRRGPLFTSTWKTEPPLVGEVVYVNESTGERRTLTRRGAIRFRDKTSVVVEGEPLDDHGRDGVIALLALPPGTPDDYPALLLRCPDHGDVVVDRTDALAVIRRPDSEPWRVRTSKPFTEYRYHDPGAAWLRGLGQTRHYHETRQIFMGGSTPSPTEGD